VSSFELPRTNLLFLESDSAAKFALTTNANYSHSSFSTEASAMHGLTSTFGDELKFE
ncbi:unnamed protein product, partial [Amoebophrya sp. A120]